MIDLCRNITDIDPKRYESPLYTLHFYYLVTIIKLTIYPCIVYALYIYILTLNHIPVIFEYRNISISIFTLAVLFIIPSYEIVIEMYKERRNKLVTLCNLKKNNVEYIESWKHKVLVSSYLTVVDLVLAKKYSLLTDSEYDKIKSQYVEQHVTNVKTNNNEFILTSHLSDEERFNDLEQCNIDHMSFVSIVELKNTLEISDEEFNVLKNNYISNIELANIKDLDSLLRLDIITEFEYYKKLYNQEKQWRFRKEWESSIARTNMVVIFIIGIGTFIASR